MKPQRVEHRQHKLKKSTLFKISEDMKKFAESDKGIKLVKKPSDLDIYDNDPDVLRAELSCGHVTDPATLTDSCKAQMDDGKTEFKCPLCKEEWSYDEVRKLAKLTIDEQLNFEDTVGTNSVKKLFKECSGCDTFIERLNVSNLCVECSICTARNGKTYEFCWQCMREWKGPRPRADRCGNEGCRSAAQELLRDCEMITLKSVQNVQCPAIRACPFCGVLIEHSNEGCKIMKCRECTDPFCFVCLKPADECIKTANHYIVCTAGVAPKQTD